MILKDVISYLESKDPSIVLPHGFAHPHSYRGYYECLAFEPAENVTVGTMLSNARRALNATYEGYKGGSFTMDEYTDVYLAQYGNTGETLSMLTIDAMFYLAERAALIKACEAAYLRMLHLPLSSDFRFHSNSELARLRDAIALVRGASSEDVQNEFEERAGATP